MIINPFASLNDGLIDITWISDPAWQGASGVRTVMSEARSGGGIQAYKAHSTYMRGRKIKIIFKDKDADEEPELDFENDQANGGTGSSDNK